MSEPITVKDVRGDDVVLLEDFGVQAQQAAEEHIANCWSWLRADETDESEGDSPAIGPFCGCTTCEVREILYASLPFLQAGFARDGEAPVEPYAINLVKCPNQETTDV